MYGSLVRAGLEDSFYCKQRVDLNAFQNMIFQNHKDSWAVEIGTKPKLRTYCEIKHVYSPENYVLFNMTKRKRSLCAQIRAGILGLHIERDRALYGIGRGG